MATRHINSARRRHRLFDSDSPYNRSSSSTTTSILIPSPSPIPPPQPPSLVNHSVSIPPPNLNIQENNTASSDPVPRDKARQRRAKMTNCIICGSNKGEFYQCNCDTEYASSSSAADSKNACASTTTTTTSTTGGGSGGSGGSSSSGGSSGVTSGFTSEQWDYVGRKLGEK
ncbi:uncharacterized protein HMPREF1120_02881 [Exophiala dermatitidis NIH/UT8656]|uniref:Uncharacterized protein n=1 Tax=Exophiala dermatitidis (strain ATCC 34100 / CBS 525.76 / NIH/UT8656) TaxID=858893 RepID=H6BRD5_EXODN|nr:uncharacterized protein HMPREF1120_02881 [Exophiala dermatitidis NIH/UT8656]EHY54716.1 hypothetical protein HMPREF1120_02881 [Exophiala dermatitidis NIH/UT8656]